jgi:hypothetical protein
MKALKIAGIAALAVVAILIAMVLAQPTRAHVEKSIVIKGPSSSISDQIGGFQSFDAWSPWSKISPEVKYTIVTFEGFDGTFCSEIKLQPEGANTKVTWIYDGINDGFKGKAMWMLMKGRMQDQYNTGLAALKKLIESKEGAPGVKTP